MNLNRRVRQIVNCKNNQQTKQDNKKVEWRKTSQFKVNYKFLNKIDCRRKNHNSLRIQIYKKKNKKKKRKKNVNWKST